MSKKSSKAKQKRLPGVALQTVVSLPRGLLPIVNRLVATAMLRKVLKELAIECLPDTAEDKRQNRQDWAKLRSYFRPADQCKLRPMIHEMAMERRNGQANAPGEPRRATDK